MNKTTSTREQRLSDIIIDPILYPVSDELAGLERLVPEAPTALERYAAFWNQRPALVPIRARAGFHAGELKRFMTLAHADISEIEQNLDSCNALSILVNSANMTMLMVAPRTAHDAWAQEAFAKTLRRQVRRLKDARFRAQVDRVLPRDKIAATAHDLGDCTADDINAFIGHAAASFTAGPAPHGAVQGEPAVFKLEHAPSLDLWFDQSLDFTDLLAGVRELLAMARGWNGPWEGTADECQMAADAAAGARLLAFARLARIGLWPARDRAEVAVKNSARRLLGALTAEPDTMRAIAEIAFDQGEILAGQSDRFMQMPPA